MKYIQMTDKEDTMYTVYMYSYHIIRFFNPSKIEEKENAIFPKEDKCNISNSSITTFFLCMYILTSIVGIS